jgi:putative hydrolase of the HAD superfamily
VIPPLNIVFDFGAVLVNWRPHDVVRKHFPDIAHSQEQVAQLSSSLFSHDDWQGFDAGRLTSEEISSFTARRLSLNERAVWRMVDDIKDHIAPIASSVQALEKLHAEREARGYKLYFLSNMPILYARGLERHAFMRCFDGGIFSGDVGLIKPQPEIFEKLEAMYGLQGQKILFIDDHPANIAAANKLGWQTLHLVDPSKLPELLLAQLHQSMP